MRQEKDVRPRPAVRRTNTKDLPQSSWECFRLGHQWTTAATRSVAGWGPNVDAEEELIECTRGAVADRPGDQEAEHVVACTRWRRDVVDAATGELLYRDYGGGTYAWAGHQPTKAEARAHEIARRRQLRMLELQMADRSAALEERVAVAEHRAERDR